MITPTLPAILLMTLGALAFCGAYYVNKVLFYFLCLTSFICMLVLSSEEASAADWSKPGLNPYVLSVPDAVDNYKDIPKETRAKLKQMMQPPHKPTDTVLIGASTITGKQEYANLRDMHWGKARTFTAGAVTRNLWSSQDTQRAFVYCADGYCIAVPFVCRNVSRIDVLPVEELKNEPVVTVVTDGVSFEEASIKEQVPNTLEVGEYGYDTKYFSSIQFTPVYIYKHDVNFLTKPPVFIAAPVPEPSTYALMIVGMLGVMFVAKRRRQQ